MFLGEFFSKAYHTETGNFRSALHRPEEVALMAPDGLLGASKRATE